MKEKIHAVGFVSDCLDHADAFEQALAETLPSARLRVFSTESEILGELRANVSASELDLIITATALDSDTYAGLNVIAESWAWLIPCVLVVQVENTVAVPYPRFRVNGDKGEASVWSKVLDFLLAEPIGVVQNAVNAGKRQAPDYRHGNLRRTTDGIDLRELV